MKLETEKKRNSAARAAKEARERLASIAVIDEAYEELDQRGEKPAYVWLESTGALRIKMSDKLKKALETNHIQTAYNLANAGPDVLRSVRELMRKPEQRR